MYDHSIDTWALGILLYELVHGQAPFPGKREQITRSQLAMKIPFRKDVTPQYKDLVKKLLNYDAENRLALVEIFAHIWVKKYQEKSFPDWEADDEDSNSDLDSDDSDDSDEYDEEEEYEEEGEDEYEYYAEESTPGDVAHSENIEYVNEPSVTPSGNDDGNTSITETPIGNAKQHIYNNQQKQQQQIAKNNQNAKNKMPFG